MNDTFPMQIRYCFQQLAEDPSTLLDGWIFLKEFTQRASVNILHYNSRSDNCILFIGKHINDIRAVEADGNFILSSYQGIQSSGIVLRCLDNKILAVPADPVQTRHGIF